MDTLNFFKEKIQTYINSQTINYRVEKHIVDIELNNNILNFYIYPTMNKYSSLIPLLQRYNHLFKTDINYLIGEYLIGKYIDELIIENAIINSIEYSENIIIINISVYLIDKISLYFQHKLKI